jgi:hypothetical protein
MEAPRSPSDCLDVRLPTEEMGSGKLRRIRLSSPELEVRLLGSLSSFDPSLQSPLATMSKLSSSS